MNGIILALMLNYGILGTSPTIDAAITGGYHLGPVYATVSVETLAEQNVFAWAYYPYFVCYDFRVGIKLAGFDIGLSRWCDHDVSGGRLPESWGLSFYAKWSNW